MSAPSRAVRALRWLLLLVAAGTAVACSVPVSYAVTRVYGSVPGQATWTALALLIITGSAWAVSALVEQALTLPSAPPAVTARHRRVS